LVTRIATAGFLTMFGGMYPDQLGNIPPWRGYRKTIEELDVLLYQEIRERRAAVDERRTDVLSRLLRADSGELTDVELRDELVTLLLAGHETTSTALSWTLLELARHPAILGAATEAADGEGKEADDYLEACVKEAMRLRPVISQVARKLTEPTRVGDYLLPAGTVVAPSIFLVQRAEQQHRNANRYVPQRFLDGSVTTGNWFPFGGGVRRCIGAGFSLMESVAILRAVLRNHDLRAPAGAPERIKTRNITLVPSRGATVLLSPRATRPIP
jgi:cytochrome P450